MLAESIPSKVNRVSDMFFTNVINATKAEKQQISIKEPLEEHVFHEKEGSVEPLVSHAKANTLLHNVIQAVKSTDLENSDGMCLFSAAGNESPIQATQVTDLLVGSKSNDNIDLELGRVITPQLVIRLGPCGPIEKQFILVGFSLTQASFLAWASVLHLEDKQIAGPSRSSVTILDFEDNTNDVVECKRKRAREEEVEVPEKETKKIKLDQIKIPKPVNKGSKKGKIVETRRIRELKKIASDKEGRKQLEQLGN